MSALLLEYFKTEQMYSDYFLIPTERILGRFELGPVCHSAGIVRAGFLMFQHRTARSTLATGLTSCSC